MRSESGAASIDFNQNRSDLPFVTAISGEVAPNGRAIGLRIQRSAQGPVDLCLRSEDLQQFISIILALAHEAGRLQLGSDANAPAAAAIPLPITALSVGRTPDEQSFLVVDHGVVSLTFGVPLASLTEVGQTLLALTGSSEFRPS